MSVRLRRRVAVTVATNLACVAAFYTPVAGVQVVLPWLVENGWLTARVNFTPAEPTMGGAR